MSRCRTARRGSRSSRSTPARCRSPTTWTSARWRTDTGVHRRRPRGPGPPGRPAHPAREPAERPRADALLRARPARDPRLGDSGDGGGVPPAGREPQARAPARPHRLHGRRRPAYGRPVSGRISSAARRRIRSVVSQPMQASVTETPYSRRRGIGGDVLPPLAQVALEHEADHLPATRPARGQHAAQHPLLPLVLPLGVAVAAVDHEGRRGSRPPSAARRRRRSRGGGS